MTSESAPQFSEEFRTNLDHLLTWRRDVRRFLPDPLPDPLLDRLIQLACLSPSVGFSQPWRWVTVQEPQRRTAIIENFRKSNQEALGSYSATRAALYARLKLAGLEEAPVHLAVFADHDTSTGHGLGRRTMPEMLSYSVVCAVHSLWLAARAHGVGVGWVSILDPKAAKRTLDVPAHWQLIAYLCLGYPEREQPIPELEMEGWEARQETAVVRVAR